MQAIRPSPKIRHVLSSDNTQVPLSWSNVTGTGGPAVRSGDVGIGADGVVVDNGHRGYARRERIPGEDAVELLEQGGAAVASLDQNLLLGGRHSRVEQAGELVLQLLRARLGGCRSVSVRDRRGSRRQRQKRWSWLVEDESPSSEEHAATPIASAIADTVTTQLRNIAMPFLSGLRRRPCAEARRG